MSNIQIIKNGITNLALDAIVNAANSGLRAGSGGCGAIFAEAGHRELQNACDEIGHCDTGSAVITPGFKLKAKHIIHAVGPIWQGGSKNEPELLYGAYYNSFELAKQNDLHSIAFPLISSGIFGYPKDEAWEVAIKSCMDFLENNKEYNIEITFAVLDDSIKQLGEKVLKDKLEA